MANWGEDNNWGETVDWGGGVVLALKGFAKKSKIIAAVARLFYRRRNG